MRLKTLATISLILAADRTFAAGLRAPRPPAVEKAEGEAFLRQNAGREGVVVRPSGLQYRIVKTGDGPTPRAADKVVCHYRGTFVDGAEFDSSYRRGRPALLNLPKLIAGWREALLLMPVGSRWQIVVPSDLAYGTRGLRGRSRSAGRIGPNTTLVFELELLGIAPPPPGEGERTASEAGAARTAPENGDGT